MRMRGELPDKAMREHSLIIRGISKRLWYNLFTHAMIIPGQEREIRYWARQNHITKCRFYTQRKGRSESMLTTIYCDGETANRFMAEWAGSVTHYHAPLDRDAERMLLEGITIDVRDRLWYGKYRWSVRFWTHHRNQSDMDHWVVDTFGSDTSGYRYNRNRWSTTLYLDDGNHALLSLVGAPCKIESRVRCYTSQEIAAAIR